MEQQRPESGIDLITAERRRQVSEEGWTPEHDAGHADGTLATAAVCYALPRKLRDETCTELECGGRYVMTPRLWPWHPDWYKPGEPLRDLVRAGALIAAEIDRLLAKGGIPGA